MKKKRAYRKNGTNSTAMKARWAKLKKFEAMDQADRIGDEGMWRDVTDIKSTHVVINLRSGEVVASF